MLRLIHNYAGDAGSGEGYERESATLTGLAPGTTYHYRLVISNSAGTAYGEDAAFTTYSTVPAGSPLALSIGQAGAELPVPASIPLLPTISPSTETTTPSTSKPKTATRAEKLSKALKQLDFRKAPG